MPSRSAVWNDLVARRPADAFTPARVLRELALQDWVLLGYLCVLLACTLGGEGPRRPVALAYLTVDLLLLTAALVLVRGGALRGVAGALVYRAGLFAGVFGSFSQLQYVLPTASRANLDAQLYALDRSAFGFEPAEVLDGFVTPATTEWFAFFYFGYFVVLAVHIFPFMFGARDAGRLAELALGLVLLFCVGQLLYLVVPGYGPYHHLAGRFTHELDGPFWWRLVRATVDAGEVTARTDIFPSLHTAAPTYLAAFSFRHRHVAPFKWTWAPLAFFASQIVISTMFLRWHYLVDVIAGLVLAFGVAYGAGRAVRWESRRRADAGRAPVWTLLV